MLSLIVLFLIKICREYGVWVDIKQRCFVQSYLSCLPVRMAERFEIRAKRPAFGEGDFMPVCRRYRNQPEKLSQLAEALYISRVLVQDGLRWSDPASTVLSLESPAQLVHIAAEPNAAYFLRLGDKISQSDLERALCFDTSTRGQLVFFKHNESLMLCIFFFD